MSAFVVCAVHQEAANAHSSHFPERDFLFASHHGPSLMQSRDGCLRLLSLLHSEILSLVPIKKSFQGRRQIARFFSAALPQLAGDVFRNVPRPALSGIESNYANRIAILAVRHRR